MNNDYTLPLDTQKRIARLELTRRNSALLRNRDNPPQQHGGVCPKCGQNTLHFMEGCMTCVACGIKR